MKSKHDVATSMCFSKGQDVYGPTGHIRKAVILR